MTRVVVFAIGLAALALHALRYYPFLADDALISLRYARNFVDGLGLVWNAGERVEGYSNLSWILLCSALHALGVDLVTAARGLGAACGALLVLALAFLSGDSASMLSRLWAPFFLATLGCVAAWLLAGLNSRCFTPW